MLGYERTRRDGEASPSPRLFPTEAWIRNLKADNLCEALLLSQTPLRRMDVLQVAAMTVQVDVAQCQLKGYD